MTKVKWSSKEAEEANDRLASKLLKESGVIDSMIKKLRESVDIQNFEELLREYVTKDIIDPSKKL